jgi:hypothetical protein
MPSVPQALDGCFVRRPRRRSGRNRRRLDGVRAFQRRRRPGRQSALGEAKLISSLGRRRRHWARELRGEEGNALSWSERTNNTASLYARRKFEPIFHTPSRGEFPLASTLLYLSTFSLSQAPSCQRHNCEMRYGRQWPHNPPELNLPPEGTEARNMRPNSRKSCRMNALFTAIRNQPISKKSQMASFRTMIDAFQQRSRTKIK